MKVLFDHCVPKPLRKHLPQHEIRTAYQMGWDGLKNGQLLDAAEVEFDVLLTVDQNISHQQNMPARRISLVVVIAPNNTVASLLLLVPALVSLLPTVEPGKVYTVGPSAS